MGQVACCQASYEDYVEISNIESEGHKGQGTIDSNIRCDKSYGKVSENCDSESKLMQASELFGHNVKEAMADVEKYLREFDLDSADEAMSTWLNRLNPPAQQELKGSTTYRKLQRSLGQYDLAKEMILSEGFEVLWQQDSYRMEIKRDPLHRVFEYRLVMELDQPLDEVLSHFEEQDLVHKVQKQLSKPVETYGDINPWQKVYMMSFHLAAIIKVELVTEFFRYRGKKDGYILEVMQTEFDHAAHGIPEKSWLTTRPWLLTSTLWRPHEADPKRTVLTQVTRAEGGMRLSSWMIDAACYLVAKSFTTDVRNFAKEVTRPGNAWRDRILQDKDGFYSEIEKIKQKATTTGQCWQACVLDRCWQTPPERRDGIPPSHRK
ncbi:Hypothetical protein SCF082_LOCUS45916 [Durusdinium trenchii]|uniref:Uncharacterized protein n=1 Tax=Durusdinium trenchii TaxID=1381693 RepID=A0ABP0RDR6_9DINO